MRTIKEITNCFLQLEVESGFFDITVNGVPIWERFRFPVYRSILESTDLIGQAHSRVQHESRLNNYAHIAKSTLRGSLGNNPFFSSNHNVLVWGHERRKQLEDGIWWDIYCDPIYNALNLDYVHLESPYLDQHRQPAETDNLRYTELIENSARLWQKLGIGIPSVTEQEEALLTSMEDEIEVAFEHRPDLVESVRHQMALRKPLQILYRTLLQRIDPDVVLVVVSYGKETFIETCKELYVPVVELQHGVIHPQHLAYSYPANREKETFPDYLLVWGEHWKNAVEYPIPDERVIPVGYPFLEQRKRQYTEVEPKDQILFISQGTIGYELSKFALEVDRYPDIDHEIVYKLHPGEYDRWRDEYPWLVESDIKVIDNSGPPLYELFASSNTQIGVSSTALYEGLVFGLETYLYKCAGSEELEHLVNGGAAEWVTGVTELASSLCSGSLEFDREHYFVSGPDERICQVLDTLTENSKPTVRE